MNVESGTEAPIFLFWEYLFQIFGILSLQCGNLQYESSQNYAQKPQQNCMFMNSASGLPRASVHSWGSVEGIDRYCKLFGILKRVIHEYRQLCIDLEV
jgi:hypothetical protein